MGPLKKDFTRAGGGERGGEAERLICILYAARRPADPVKFCPCFILRRFLLRASYLEIRFCAPFGALRLSARLIGGGGFYSESMILSRIDYLIPHNIRELRGEGIKRKGEGGGGREGGKERTK